METDVESHCQRELRESFGRVGRRSEGPEGVKDTTSSPTELTNLSQIGGGGGLTKDWKSMHRLNLDPYTYVSDVQHVFSLRGSHNSWCPESVWLCCLPLYPSSLADLPCLLLVGEESHSPAVNWCARAGWYPCVAGWLPFWVEWKDGAEALLSRCKVNKQVF